VPTAIRAIDVHAHYGVYRSDAPERLNGFYTGGLEVVLERARRAGTVLSLVSPLEALMPRGSADTVSGNRHAAEQIAGVQGILQYVVVDPLKPETFAQAEDRLGRFPCAGIKIHPENHGYPIARHGDTLFAFAAEHRAVVQSHSGDANSRPEDFVPFADAFPGVPLILAHLGWGGGDGDTTRQVRAILKAKHRTIYTDTSSAMSMTSGLLEWAVKEAGADRILYGTDSPLYFAPMQRARIECADLPDAAKRMILRENAEALFGLTDLLSRLDTHEERQAHEGKG